MSPQFSRGIESSGWLRWLLDRWGVQYRDVTAEDIATGGLKGAEVLLVPDGYALKDPSVPSDPYGYKDLGPKGRANLKAFVENGGRYVGWLDGGVLASALGISGTVYGDGGDAGVSTPGSLFRVRVNDGSPLAAGVGPFAWTLDDARYVLSSGAGASVPLRYPDASSSDFFVSGQADGAAALGGRPAATDERVGRGRVVAFAFDPNFRAFADGTEKILRNAVFGADPRPRAHRRHGWARRGGRPPRGGRSLDALADRGQGPAAADREGPRGAQGQAHPGPLRDLVSRPARPRARDVRDREPGRRGRRRAPRTRASWASRCGRRRCPSCSTGCRRRVAGRAAPVRRPRPTRPRPAGCSCRRRRAASA
jgi:hypothetical protein